MRAAGTTIALVLAVSCGGGGGGAGRPVPAEPVREPVVRPAPPADAATPLPTGRGTFLAAPLAGTVAVHAAPGTTTPYMSLDAQNPWRQRLQLLILDGARDDDGGAWLRVQLPIWPNGQEGWVDADDVTVSKAPERIVVDLSRRRLLRFRDGAVVARASVAIGKPSTPTPPGRYVIWARFATGHPSGPYGSFVLGLSGFSESIDPAEWPGLPRLAIHGTDDPSDAGQAVSSGCIRVPNALLRGIRDVPMGTPVVIRA